MIISLILSLPYIHFFDPEMETTFGDQFIDQPIRNPAYIILISPLFYPLVLYIESTLFKSPKIWHRIIFLIQALYLICGSYVIMVIMTYHPVCGRFSVGINYYLTIIYLLIGITWNFVLCFLYNKKSLFPIKAFHSFSTKDLFYQ